MDGIYRMPPLLQARSLADENFGGKSFVESQSAAVQHSLHLLWLILTWIALIVVVCFRVISSLHHHDCDGNGYGYCDVYGENDGDGG